MTKKLQDKIKLFRVIHGVNEVYISSSGQLFIKKPENFTGKWLGWYKSGQLKYEWNYKNGKDHGKCLGWYENGQLECEGNYKNGEKHGKWFRRHANGQLKYEINYKDGERID